MLEELRIWEMIMSLPFYEVNGDGRIVGLKILKYLEIARSQEMDSEIALELLKSANFGVISALNRKDPSHAF